MDAAPIREGENRQDAGKKCNRARRDQPTVQQQQGSDGIVPAGAGYGSATGSPSCGKVKAYHQKRGLRGKFRNLRHINHTIQRLTKTIYL